MNEFDFIRRLRDQTQSRKHSARLVTGVGDDASVISQLAERAVVVTTDLLAEGIDFYRDATPPRLLGHKALAVSLSDIAAMGARPLWSLVSIGLPSEIWDQNFKDEFFEGYLTLADEYGVALAGGDVSRTVEQIVIDSILLGEVSSGAAVLRSTAQPGDQIYVTGTLGGAAAGLKLIEMGARLGNTGLAFLPRPGQRGSSPTVREGLPERAQSIEIQGDARMLRQALLNLVRNAAEAIEEDKIVRRVTVSLSTQTEPGQAWATVSISDTGHGIPEADLQRIFIPFFTTKSQGHGVGLALAHRVITEHGGTLTVANAVDGGALFTIRLPR